MAWTNPMVFTVGQILTAAQLNANLSGNLNYLRSSATAIIVVGDNRTSGTWGDCVGSVGPAVTLTTDVQAIVTLWTTMVNNTLGGSSLMGFAVSGATTIAASDSYSLGFVASHATANQLWATASFLVTGLTPGSNTFTGKYRSGGTDNAAYNNRRITVQPA